MQTSAGSINANSFNEIFTGEIAWCKEKIHLTEELAEAVPLQDFLFGDGMGNALSRYQSSHGGCDARAAASFWSLYYFSTLSIPFIYAASKNIRLPVDAANMTIKLEDNGLPSAFGITGALRSLDEAEPLAWINLLIDDHLADVVLLLKKVAGISQKLSWNNAAVYIEYALKSYQGAASVPTAHDSAAAVFTSRFLPDGNANPFLGCLKYECIDDVTYCRRKLCCLRYLLPGIDGCGELCAKPELRR